MAPTLPPSVEKYQRILQADPRSRIFVELARALLEAGESERALEVCRRGLEHHPDSVQARVVAAKALLALGRGDDAVAEFEDAVAADPANPYAYDLAGEALVQAGLAASALPLLDAAVARHPGDARLRRWLDEARAALGPQTPTDGPRHAAPLPDPLPDARGEGDETRGSPTPTPTPHATAAPAATSTWAATAVPLPAPPAPVEERTEDAPDPDAESISVSVEEPPAVGAPSDPDPLPDPASTPRPPPIRRATPPPTLLELIPELAEQKAEPAAFAGLAEPEPEPARAHASPGSADAAREAEEAARTYEHELRQKLLAEQAARPSFLHRHGKALAAVAALVVLAAGAITFFAVRAQRRAAEARLSAVDARKGLARDTAGALRAASEVLTRVLAHAPGSPDAEELSVEVDGLLAHDFGDADARARARALLDGGRGGPAIAVGRFLAAERQGERSAAEALQDAVGRPDATPLARTLAGELLLDRRETGAARPLLEQAARAQPPMLRAVAALGDLEAQRGELSAALERYEAVLKVQATHPHAALGAAEVRLRTGRDLPRALASLEAVEADRDSPPALGDRLRFDLVLARLLASQGRTNDAVKRLMAAAAREPADPRVAAAQAEVLAHAGELDRALRAAEGAARLAPGDASYRELLARLQLRRGLYRQLLAGTGDAPSRTLRLYRGMARLALGEPDAARAELDATRREGKMTPEAAAWTALAELASGRREQAGAIVSALMAAPSPHPVALLGQARLDLAEGHLADAERHLRDALERDADLADARSDLGRVLRARNRLSEARDVLQQAVARDPYHAPSRVELGRTRLVTGDAAGAVSDLTAALAQRPDDRDALVALSQAQLAAGHADEARQAAERAVKADPKSGAAALAAGQAAAAQRDVPAARRHLTRAAALLGKSREGLEARRALAALGKKHR